MRLDAGQKIGDKGAYWVIVIIEYHSRGEDASKAAESVEFRSLHIAHLVEELRSKRKGREMMTELWRGNELEFDVGLMSQSVKANKGRRNRDECRISLLSFEAIRRGKRDSPILNDLPPLSCSTHDRSHHQRLHPRSLDDQRPFVLRRVRSSTGPPSLVTDDSTDLALLFGPFLGRTKSKET